jgi:hypothetical protein
MGAPPYTAAGTDRETALPVREAQERLSQILAMSGGMVTQVTPGRMDGYFKVNDEPNIVLLVVLLVIWIVPGLIYWYLKSRPITMPFSLLFAPTANGTRVSVQAGPKAMDHLLPVLGQLPW